MLNAEQIMQGIRDGNSRMFELFYRMEFLNLVHFVNAFLHDVEKARDVSQETMLSLWENRTLLDTGRNLRAFVFTIAKNKTINSLRTGKHFTPVIEESLSLLEDNSVDEYINALDLTALIQKEWNFIPQKEKDMLLYRQGGLKNREISALEGVSEKTVEYRLKTVRARFKKIFKKNDISI